MDEEKDSQYHAGYDVTGGDGLNGVGGREEAIVGRPVVVSNTHQPSQQRVIPSHTRLCALTKKKKPTKRKVLRKVKVSLYEKKKKQDQPANSTCSNFTEGWVGGGGGAGNLQSIKKRETFKERKLSPPSCFVTPFSHQFEQANIL